MPEAPDLEAVKHYLTERSTGATVRSVRVIRPSVLRSLAGDLATDVVGRVLEEFERRGKFLLFHLSGDRVLVVNPMLTGAIQLCESKRLLFRRTCFVFTLSDGHDLRYLDDRQMGDGVLRYQRAGRAGPPIQGAGARCAEPDHLR